MTVTVPDVLREMNMLYSKQDSWAIGKAVQQAYCKQFHEEPPKDLRKKTNGGGSHCFAVYPNSFKSKIVEIISAHQLEKDSVLF